MRFLFPIIHNTPRTYFTRKLFVWRGVWVCCSICLGFGILDLGASERVLATMKAKEMATNLAIVLQQTGSGRIFGSSGFGESGVCLGECWQQCVSFFFFVRASLGALLPSTSLWLLSSPSPWAPSRTSCGRRRWSVAACARPDCTAPAGSRSARWSSSWRRGAAAGSPQWIYVGNIEKLINVTCHWWTLRHNTIFRNRSFLMPSFLCETNSFFNTFFWLKGFFNQFLIL